MKKPKVKSGIKIVIHGIKKVRETRIQDTVGVVQVGTTQVFAFKHKSENKYRTESEYFWANGKKFKDKRLENGLEFDSYKLLTLGKFTVKRNIDFLTNILKGDKTKSLYQILKMGS
jgi:hypothetical protein